MSRRTSYRQMRILQIITTLGVGGAETMLRNVALTLDRQRFEQRVVTLRSLDTIGAQLSAAGIPVMALDIRKQAPFPWRIRRVTRLVREWRPDIIHAWMYHANLVGHWVVGASRPRPTLITSIRGALNAPSSQRLTLRVVRQVDARLSSRAAAVLFNSRTSAQQHQQIGYPADRTIVIPNGFDTQKFAPDPAARTTLRSEIGLGDDLAIGMVARFEPVKGHRLLLEAAARVVRMHPRCRFVLAGRNCDAANRDLAAWLRELQLEGSVILLGQRPDVPALMNAFDIVVCPSLSESFPNAVGEAMSSAVPCVVTDVGDCGFLVGDTGRVARPADAASLAAGIVELAGLDAGARSALGQRARERIRAEFALDAVIARYGQLYAERA